MHQFRPLHDGWTVRADRPDGDGPTRPVDAVVPGCVHTDLLAAGLIPDPFLDDNEVRLGWIGRTGWVYETTFDLAGDDADRVDLHCAGLDTVATVLVNGTEVGRTRNMHRSYRFDVRDLLGPTGNRLTVRFDSAYAYAEDLRERLGERPGAYPQPYQFIRKMACNFGWDWGPTLVTAGIWQPIGLSSWSVARLAEVRPLVTVSDDHATGRVEAHVTVERAGDAPLTVTATVGGHTGTAVVPAGASTAVVVVEVPRPLLWWPRGYGEPHRYPVTVTLSAAGPVLDSWTRRIGFRRVDLDTGADADGSRFTLRVNDVPVFVRGVNWIPDHAFVTLVDRARYAERLGQARDANVNYLRVWGGGRYESEDFYDLADEHGLMVGQDFLFACAAYPEEEPLAGEVAAEAREQVVRLAPHPSLLVWFGNNENLEGFHDWNWQAPLAGRSWGGGYYFDLLPAILAATDPTRPYWPGSPYSGTPARHPNDPAHGTVHIWDVWNRLDYRAYRDHRPRFVAEFGFQAPPTYATLRRSVTDDPLTPSSPGVLHHQKADDGNGKLLRGLAGHLPVPTTFDDWHWATQLNQARAIRFGIEHFRSLAPLCAGTILWQLNDTWPVTSWATIDGDGRRKPLWYALRRAYSDRLLTMQPRGTGPALVAVNNAAASWREQVEVTRRTFAGGPRAKTTVDLDLAPGEAITVALPSDVATPDDPAAELIVAGSGPDRALWFFAEDVDLRYPRPRFTATVEPVPAGLAVRVTASTLLRDLALFPDRLDPAASTDDALLTLLPGETATVTVCTGRDLDRTALLTAPVLRCANDLIVGNSRLD